MWWDRIRPGRGERNGETVVESDAVALIRPLRTGGEAVISHGDLGSRQAIVDSPVLKLVESRAEEPAQQLVMDEPIVVNASSAVATRRHSSRGAPVHDDHAGHAVREIHPSVAAAAADPRARVSGVVASLEDLRQAFPEWKGECLEGVVAPEMSRSMAVLWLGLGDVALLGYPDVLSGAHASTVRERVRNELHLRLTADIPAAPSMVAKVVESALEVVAQTRGGKPSRENYHLVIYDEIVSASVRARASDIHFKMRKAPKDNALVSLRMFGRMRAWRPEMSASLLRGVLGAGFGRRLIPSTNSKPALHFDSEIGFMTDNAVDGVKWVGRCNGRAAVSGYKLVQRLLESDPDASRIPSLEELGYVESHCSMLRMVVKRNYGVVIIFGSTGSGKSTTLRTFMVRETNPLELEIYSVESPVEYEMPGVSQFSIPVDVNMTNEEMAHKFRAVLRDVVRMDPDVLMVGEIRDHETAVLMSEFTRSDHRCYTTAHGKGASDGLSRLCGEEIKMPAEVVGGDGFISASIYQRLLPKLCKHCKLPVSSAAGLPKEKLDVVRKKYQLDPGTMFIARDGGCERCMPDVPGLAADGTKGVTVAAEVLMPDARMRELIAARDWPALTRAWRQSRRSGFGDGDMVGKTAYECALYLASQGTISVLDIEREFEPLESYEILPTATDAKGVLQ